MDAIMLFNKPVGTVRGHTFITQRRKEHFFRIFQGFGLSCAVLTQLRRRGVDEVVFVYVRDDGSQAAYSCPVGLFYEQGRHWTDKEADAQLIVPIALMQAI